MPVQLTPNSPVTDPQLADLIRQRFNDICDGEDYDPDFHGLLILVQPGDTLQDIEDAADCNFFADLDDVPVECLEEHRCCYELVFIPGDGDFGIVIFVPKRDGMDPALLAFCTDYATPAPEEP